MILFLKIILKGLKKFLINPYERRFVWLVIRHSNSKRYALKNIKSSSYKFKVPDALSFIWQYKEIFADDNYKFTSTSEFPLIYDCGANVGTSCFYFSKEYPKSIIKAFEADPNISYILKQNLQNNNLKNVEVISKAVWINNETIELSLEGADGASIYSKSDPVNVPAIRLKEWIEQEKQIDMLKMDIEGAEYDVIMDCKDSLINIKNIFIEYHSYTSSNQNLSEILGVLEKNNFRYFIKPVNDREHPFINKKNKNNPNIDLQLNIYGYK